MPDITMCKNESCARKTLCERYTATPDKYWQSYAVFTGDKCYSPNDAGLKMLDKNSKKSTTRRQK